MFAMSLNEFGKVGVINHSNSALHAGKANAGPAGL